MFSIFCFQVVSCSGEVCKPRNVSPRAKFVSPYDEILVEVAGEMLAVPRGRQREKLSASSLP